MANSTSTAGSVGALARDLPGYAITPPVEAVVFAWGAAEDGQLGIDSDRDAVLSPKVVEALLGTRLRGREFNRAPLVAGSRNTVAVDADGRLLAWGWNARSTLGAPRADRAAARKPVRLPPPGAAPLVQAALGGWHALALDADGKAWAWGGNEYAQCGTPPADTGRDVAAPAPCLPHLTFAQVAAGGMHSTGVTADGNVWTWGERWGDFSVRVDRAPRPLPLPRPVAKVACGAFHTLALLDGGDVVAWGINDFGQLGNGGTTPSVLPSPVVGLPPAGAADVAAGGWHSLALTPDGGVYVWGRGEYGRLGLGDRAGASRLRATRVDSLDGVRIVQASAGGTHTAALADDGSLYAWGRGSFGRLGTGDERERCAPARVPLPGGADRWRVVSVTCGGRHTVALAVPVGDEGERAAAAAARGRPPPPPRWSDAGSTRTTAAAAASPPPPPGASPPQPDPATAAVPPASSAPLAGGGGGGRAGGRAGAATPPIALPRRTGSARSLPASERSSMAGGLGGDGGDADDSGAGGDADDDDDDAAVEAAGSLRAGAAAGLTSALARAALDAAELAEATARDGGSPPGAAPAPPPGAGRRGRGGGSPAGRDGGARRPSPAAPSPLGRASSSGGGG